MSIRYRNANGDEVICAGLTPGGDIEAGAVARKTGTFSFGELAPDAYEVVNITFSDGPMPDADYDIILNNHGGNNFVVSGKSATGFSVFIRNNDTTTHAASGTNPSEWTAVKIYSVQHAQQNAESIATLEAMVPAGAGAGNKLVTASQLTNTTSPIADAVADIQDLIPVGASISNQLVTKSEASVDSALSSTSEHAVQNKVVKAAIDAKQDTLTFDNTPTAGSSNPVKSSGIYDTATDIYEVMGKNGAKNLLYNEVGTTVMNGVIFTVNSNGSVTANGTASVQTWFQINYGFKLKNINYTLTGCPSGGGASTYELQFRSTEADSSQWQFCIDQGEGATVTGDPNRTYVSFIGIQSGVTVSNLTFYPMIRLASDTDSTYQPYAETNYQLTQDKMSYADNGILGAKNLLPTRGSGTTATSYGVTFTIQDDGSVIANGTATGGQAIFQVHFKVPLKKDVSYVISGGISPSKFTYVNAINNNSYVKTIGLSVGDHDNPYDTNPFTPDYVGYTHLEVGVAINSGVTCNNDRFYPMIRLASDPDETYQPYAMTNQQLTKFKVKVIQGPAMTAGTEQSWVLKDPDTNEVLTANQRIIIGQAGGTSGYFSNNIGINPNKNNQYYCWSYCHSVTGTPTIPQILVYYLE